MAIDTKIEIYENYSNYLEILKTACLKDFQTRFIGINIDDMYIDESTFLINRSTNKLIYVARRKDDESLSYYGNIQLK